MIVGNLDLNKIGARLKRTDKFLIDILSIRLANGGLSDFVAATKRKKDDVYGIRRPEIENARIEAMKEWAISYGINPNFAAGLMYNIMSESCLVQHEIMVDKYQKHESSIDENNPELVYEFYQHNLLNLIASVTDSYDEGYGKGFLGSELYFAFEKSVLHDLITKLKNKSLAIDFGCATGIMANEMASRGFKKVIGYDLSPDMIKAAEAKAIPNSEFINTDIEKGIDLPDNSVSLAVMNMGTASDIEDIEGVLKELKRCLTPDGKFLLSFYNSESLLARLGFIPWPLQQSARFDYETNCLEVHHNKKVYFLYAKTRDVDEVKTLLHDFKIDNILTFPTIASVLPDIVLEGNENAREFIDQLDRELATSAMHCGNYIIVTGGKK